MASKLYDCDWVKYAESFVFLTLTETFIDNDFDLSGVFHDFIKFVCPAVKLSYHGRRSGGLLVVVKKQLAKFAERISVDCDNVIVLKLSGALLGTEENCLFLSTYVPPCGSRFYESAESNCHIAEVEQCICELLERFGDVNLICNGDFNARTATYQVNQALAQNCGFQDDVTDTTVIWENSRISQDSNINDFGTRRMDRSFL